MDDLDRVAARLRIALDMHDAGVDIMRHNLRRRMPGACEMEIAEALHAWLRAKAIPASDAPETRAVDAPAGVARC